MSRDIIGEGGFKRGEIPMLCALNKPKSLTDLAVANDIVATLRKIERVFGVTILFAVESGSRAWGFEGVDSDYDVRFVYIEKEEYYLGLPKARAVSDQLKMEDLRSHPEFADLHPDYDFDGWEFKKALKYTLCSKTALIEWCNSPIAYCDHLDYGRNFFKTQLAKYVHHRPILDHYMGIKIQVQTELNKKPEHRPLKKLMYGVRSALAYEFVESLQADQLVNLPIEMSTLMNYARTHNSIFDREDLGAITRLLEVKRKEPESIVVDNMPDFHHIWGRLLSFNGLPTGSLPIAPWHEPTELDALSTQILKRILFNL